MAAGSEAGSVEAGSAEVASEAGAAEAGAAEAAKAATTAALKAFLDGARVFLGVDGTKGLTRLMGALVRLDTWRTETRTELIERLYGLIPYGTVLSRELGESLPHRLRLEYDEVGTRLALAHDVLIDSDFLAELSVHSAPATDGAVHDAPATDFDGVDGAAAADFGGVSGAPATDGFDGVDDASVAAAAAAAAAAQGHALRTPVEIAAAGQKRKAGKKTGRDTEAFHTLPKGPFRGPGKEAISQVYDRYAKANGFLAPFFTSYRSATSSHGEQRTICCPYGAKERAPKGTGARKSAPRVELDDGNRCPWYVTFELSTVGWVILHACCDHSGHTHTAPRYF
jgi:hypothetical protein